MLKTAPPFENDDEIAALVKAFETCALSPDDFGHPAHLTVALWYLKHSRMTEATRQMRDGLFRLLAHFGLEGYNETITVFWMRLLRGRINDSTRSLAELVNEVVPACVEAKAIFAYYSRERLSSAEAKRAWVEPDLQPLDF